MTEAKLTDSFVTQCPRCGCGELFIRNDFPQKVGIAVVIVAAVAFLILASSRQGFDLGRLVLLAAAAVDFVLYALVPKITVCYRCRAEFPDVPLNPEHGGYELAVGEKYKAR